MAEFDKKMIKDPSPLVKAVITLDDLIGELERVGGKINTMDLKSEFDFEHAKRLMARFAECGELVSAEVMNLSTHLLEARARAEAIAASVASRSQVVSAHNTDREKMLEEFQVLVEKVNALSSQMNELRQPEGKPLSDEEQTSLRKRLHGFEDDLIPLIEQAKNLRQGARLSKMRTIEQNADSLTQTLQAIQQKLVGLNLH